MARKVGDRHDLALAAGEAMLKLASGMRIGLTLSHGFAPGSPVAKRLERLLFPTPALWLDLLEELSARMVQEPPVEAVPFRDLHEQLIHPAEDTPAISAFFEALPAASTIPGGLLTDARRRGVLGFFAALVAYGETALPPDSSAEAGFYETMAPLLFDAVCEALACPALLGGFDLAVSVEGSEGVHHPGPAPPGLAGAGHSPGPPGDLFG